MLVSIRLFVFLILIRLVSSCKPALGVSRAVLRKACKAAAEKVMGDWERAVGGWAALPTKLSGDGGLISALADCLCVPSGAQAQPARTLVRTQTWTDRRD
jgi:hypothetical protein